jgi:hypothetical protein
LSENIREIKFLISYCLEDEKVEEPVVEMEEAVNTVYKGKIGARHIRVSKTPSIYTNTALSRLLPGCANRFGFAIHQEGRRVYKEGWTGGTWQIYHQFSISPMKLLRILEQLLNKDSKELRSTKERGQRAHPVPSRRGQETSSTASLNYAYPSDDSDLSSIHFYPAGDSKHPQLEVWEVLL